VGMQLLIRIISQVSRPKVLVKAITDILDRRKVENQYHCCVPGSITLNTPFPPAVPATKLRIGWKNLQGLYVIHH
jgi:hypothetical protein